MSEVSMRAREVLAAREVISRLLIVHIPIPASADGGASARAGLKLRRARRALSEAAEDIQEQLQANAATVARGADLRTMEDTNAALLRNTITISVPELLTMADWHAIPLSAEHIMPNTDAEGRPVTVTLRKSEADLDALGPLVVDADDLGESK